MCYSALNDTKLASNSVFIFGPKALEIHINTPWQYTFDERIKNIRIVCTAFVVPEVTDINKK